jgi:glutaredoxin
MDTQVLGISVDSKHSLKAWAESLGGIDYPLLSDFYPHGQIAKMFGVFRPVDGTSERAIYVIDKYCTIRYVDVHDIDLQPDNDVLFAVLADLTPGMRSTHRVETAAAAAPQPWTRPDVDVILYCTPWCPDCRRVKVYLKENDVNFIEIDITRDRAAAQRVRGWANGNETTPTIDVKGSIIVTYDKARLAKELGIA